MALFLRNVRATLSYITSLSSALLHTSADATFASVSASTALSSNETILYKFKGGMDGAFPTSLIEVNGAFFGTVAGGDGTINNDYGTVFEASTSGTERVLYDFKGNFEGDTDDIVPESLFALKGSLYGVTSAGGLNRGGTVFEMSTSGAERVLYSFNGMENGYGPVSLIAVNGALYGTTEYGAHYGPGTVFEMSTSGTERVIYSFTGGTDGAFPSSLIAVNGVLYGAAGGGGATNSGTVFEVSSSGRERVLYSFKGGMDGANPTSLIAVNGALYGTTKGYDQLPYYRRPSQDTFGTVFEMSSSGTERVLYRFKGGADGANPVSLIAVNGTLYGTTSGGGLNGGGTVFEVNTSGTERVLYSFNGVPDGASPGSLIAMNGALYGVTAYGGIPAPPRGGWPLSIPLPPDGMGTIFKVSL